MSPPNKISPELSRYYDVANGLCRPPEVLACFPVDSAATQKISEPTLRFSAARLSALASAGTGVTVSSLWKLPTILLNPIGLTVSTTACGNAPAEKTLPGKPISKINPATAEMTLNSSPISGKIRQVALGISPEAKGVVAWSVTDFDYPENHGVYGLTSEGSTVSTARQLAAATGNIPRDTSAAVLPNGQSVVVFAQVQGDNAPSSLMAQRLSASGDPVGTPIAILPETIRTGFPQGQVMASSDGFIVVFKDGEGKLFRATYDLNGIEQDRQEIGDEPLNYQIASNGAGQWALASLGSNSVRVQSFEEGGSQGFDVTIDTLPTANSADLSLAMQEDGSTMVVWNSLSGSDSVLEGAFLAPGGSQQGDNVILRNLVQGSGFDNLDHINSHSLTTDHQGNFVLAYEENRSIFAQVYNGSTRDSHSLTDVASVSPETTGPYADLVAGWDNAQVQNVDVNVAASQDGLLSFVFTKTYSGVDSSTLLTATVNKIVRRDFQITYR